MLNLAGNAGGNDRDGARVSDMFNQLNVKTAIGTILINAVQEYRTVTEFLTRLYQLLGGDVASFTTALDGALIPYLLVAD